MAGNIVMSRLIAVALIVATPFAATPLAAPFVQEGRPSGQGGEGDPALMKAYVDKLPIGSLVKVTPRDGKSFKGVLMVVEADAIVVKPRTRLPRPARRLAFSEIGFVELQERNAMSLGKAIGIGAAVAGATFLTLFLIVLTALDD